MENTTSNIEQQIKNVGSPPHTWRIHRIGIEDDKAGGITSTYVENTLTSTLLFLATKDHLHIRGEYSSEDETDLHLTGSPPHTWRILALK